MSWEESGGRPGLSEEGQALVSDGGVSGRVGGRPHCHSQGHLPFPTGDLRGLRSPLVTHQLRLPFFF